MRPVELSFTGLRSYTEFGPVSFDGKSLVGILGDTGAGKSTILEALCVALYGKCSWSERDVKDLIADGARSMSVDLTFTHDGHTWRVRRTFYANTMPSTHLLENLDTKAKFDNARPVEAQIVSMLRLDFTAFKSSVLLPQGRFATLLHASGSARTDLLKGVFGTDVLETLLELVITRRDALDKLVHDAELARGRLRNFPAKDAEGARVTAETAEQRHGELTATLDELRDAQRTAVTAQRDAEALRELHGRAEGARERLDAAGPTLADGVQAATDIAAEREKLDARERAAQDRREGARAALQTAHDAGEGPEHLGRAAAILDGAADRLADLDTLAGHADRERQRLADEEQRLADAEADEPALIRRADDLAEAEEQLSARLEEARSTTGSVRDQLRDALAAAAAGGTATRAHTDLQQQIAQIDTDLVGLRDTAGRAADTHRDALAALQSAQRAEAAATAGAHLHAGDACPVCTSTLPDGYIPPAATDPETLAAAEAAEQTTREAAAVAAENVRDAERERKGLTTQTEQPSQEARSAAAAAEAALAEAVTLGGQPSLTAPVTLPEIDGITTLDPVRPDALRTAATVALAKAAAADDPDGVRARDVADELLTGVLAFSAALRTAHAVVDTAADHARTTLTQAQAEQRAARQAYDRDLQALDVAERRITELRAGLDRDLTALPAPVAAALAADDGSALPTTARVQVLRDALPAAEQALTARRTVVEGHATALRDADGELAEVERLRHVISDTEPERVAGPLHTALAAADKAGDVVRAAWERLADQATGALTGLTLPSRAGLTDSPTIVTPEAATAHVHSVTAALAQAIEVLDTAADRAAKRAAAQRAELIARLTRALPEGTPSGAIEQPSSLLILEPEALDPVIATASAADHEARAARAEETAARAEIARAAALDAALAAGRARRDALEECRQLLLDAKFPSYLTSRRTRSLLGVASELFGKLSGQEFGFADDFAIVSRRTGVARSAKTLSGGETFLASLALALALVELYGRTGGRLGALFLDEGFGSLDVGTLDAALEVLREEAGGDKLVAVISHLHAVAEAVDDVLLVEKGAAGSAARWLGGEETEALIRDDVAAGLLSLA